ncbi:hypothetical protein [Paenarthrobacter ilicis]|uniref:hypothetical protein n=1 Tax=Paenarthrobacter ilicis TaxID=43665 RepID=UPI0028D272F3|nr:hypothetical protein [Paenarthrobacter ilicis]
MNKEQALALSDASERLVYAYVSENPATIAAAEEDLRIAREMTGEGPSPAVVERLIKNDPVNAAMAGLITFQDLQEIVLSDLDAHLSPQEVSLVADNPENLRRVLAARMSGTDVSESVEEPLIDKRDFALAARGSLKRVAEIASVLHDSLKLIKRHE